MGLREDTGWQCHPCEKQSNTHPLHSDSIQGGWAQGHVPNVADLTKPSRQNARKDMKGHRHFTWSGMLLMLCSLAQAFSPTIGASSSLSEVLCYEIFFSKGEEDYV